MHTTIQGDGKPLLLVHGIGSTALGWQPVMPALAQRHRVIAVDLPGHGATPAQGDSGTFAGLSASLQEFLTEQDLVGVDMAGSSLGGELVLEMARLGLAGNVTALNPGGFWAGAERAFVQTTLLSAAFALRGAGGLRTVLAHNPVLRSTLLSLISAKPWAIDPDLAEAELNSIAATQTFTELTVDLATMPQQDGPAAPGTGRVAIGWGRHDRLCWPVQAYRAATRFPSARLHWFEGSGHYSWWDEPDAVVQLIERTVAD